MTSTTTVRETLVARWAAEAQAWDAHLASHPEDSIYGLALCQCLLAGDRPGWAFGYSGGVFWSPTRGAAKAAWGRMRRLDRWMVGDRPKPCLESDAIRWAHF